MADWHKRLTDKQRRFVEEYMVDLNAGQAAIRAGYDCANMDVAYTIGTQNRNHPLVGAAIARLLDENSGVTKARIVDELAAIAFSDMADFFEWNGSTVTLKPSADIPNGARRAVTGIKQTTNGIELKMGDKVQALSKLWEAAGGKQRLSLENPDGTALTDNRELARVILGLLREGQKGEA